MGLGFALMERMEADRRAAKPVSSDLLHYKVATSLDMPELHVRIVASHEPTGPFGAKSVGELPAVPVAAAIANAVANATGQRAFNLPLGGGRVAEFGGDCPRGEGGCQP
jgi:CO/xanthine dehydrogenase Mo-binding subunit